MGEENQFEFNKEFGVWLKRGEKPDVAALQALKEPPPPPTNLPPTIPPALSSSVASVPGPSTPEIMSPVGSVLSSNRYSTYASPARRRYVDHSGSMVSTPTNSISRSGSTQQLVSDQTQLFTPPAIFDPTQNPEYQSYEQQSNWCTYEQPQQVDQQQTNNTTPDPRPENK